MRTIAPVLAIMLLMLALACQQEDENVGRLVDESVAAALAAVPTITPQPTATLQAGSVVTTDATVESLKLTVDSLTGRLASVESELLAQDEEFQKYVSDLENPGADAILAAQQRIVTVAANSESPLQGCYVYRVLSGGGGETFLVEWDLLGNLDSRCYDPSSSCAKEVIIGSPIPLSCGIR